MTIHRIILLYIGDPQNEAVSKLNNRPVEQALGLENRATRGVDNGRFHGPLDHFTPRVLFTLDLRGFMSGVTVAYGTEQDMLVSPGRHFTCLINLSSQPELLCKG